MRDARKRNARAGRDSTAGSGVQVFGPAGGRRPRRGPALAIRRARLGIVLLWRRWRPLPEEIDARRERLAQQARLTGERRLAAEAYHWAVVTEGRTPQLKQAADVVSGEAPAAPVSSTPCEPDR